MSYNIKYATLNINLGIATFSLLFLINDQVLNYFIFYLKKILNPRSIYLFSKFLKKYKNRNLK